MYAPGKLLMAASLLIGAVSAIPAVPLLTPVLNARAPAATDAWVTVDESGTPVTVTPVVTVVDGTTTTISAAPNAVTATVVTTTKLAEASTTTLSSAADPQATNSNGAGSFAACYNTDGTNAPFCAPSADSSLYPGTTYYITWDPSFFTSNTTVIVGGSYYNSTTGLATTQAFASASIAAGWSYYAWTVDKTLMQSGSATNITLFIHALASTSTAATSYPGPRVLVTNPPTYHQPEAKLPTGAALYIGLPSIAGFVILMIVGTCLWNRKLRRIEIGNVMSRSRHGYGIAKSRARRLGRRDKKEVVRLIDVPQDQYYRDEPQGPQQHCATVEDWDERQHGNRYERDQDSLNVRRQGEGGGHVRSNSDALGSLAGTPTEEREMGFPPHQGQSQGNAFRDEMNRQNQQRS